MSATDMTPIPARPGVTATRALEVAGERFELTDFDYPHPWMRVFVAVLASTGEVTSAARAAEINRSHAYSVRNAGGLFRMGWDEALQVYVDTLERIALRRITGEERTTTRRTRKFGEDGALVEETLYEETKTHWDNALLQFMLRARRPEVYREQVDHRVTGADGTGPVQVEVYRQPDPDRVLALARLYEQEHPDVEGTATNGRVEPTG